ncbi:ATP-dependent helicase HrpB [Roseibium sp.]|uniref:ATP-dependent helicase HrpB n=1 Tax=Roseibium sp. TaxID=1936156 RepID=UPI003A9800FA
MTRRTFASAVPIDAVLGDICHALEGGPNAVIVAEPGAGKTTRVPLALLDAPWRGDGKILMLEPRRLAARAAARRMAEELGERVGQTVGYRVRMDTKISAATRIEVVTEGVFTRMILDDPELSGVSCILFDEFHERSLDGDLGLALALDVQGAFRDDLKLVPMSATINAAAVSKLLANCPVIESRGRSYQVETRYLGRRPNERIEVEVAGAVQKALREETGSILVFLPGQGEIRRAATLLQDVVPDNCVIAPLYGALDGKAQDAAIRPAPSGLRKVVLATSIAQTSLTIEGVRVVIDAGLARVPKYEPQTGLTRLETVRVSRASADQRRGRAGRTEPGVCYRLWDEPQTAALPAHEAPEILEADLSSLALNLAAWGASGPTQLSLMDQPPSGAWEEAQALLRALHAFDERNQLTDQGKRLRKLPLAPRLAHMVDAGATRGAGLTATYLAALLSDPGVGGRDADLRDQLRRLRNDQSRRAADTRSMAERWLRLTGGKAGICEPEDAGWLLAMAYPDRIAQARGPRGRFRLANGRGAVLPEEHSLAGAAFLVVADIQGSAANGRILLCAPISREEIEEQFANDIVEEDVVTLEKDGIVRARRVRRLGSVELDSRQISKPDQAAIERAVLGEVQRRGIARLPWTNDQLRLRDRVSYLRQTGEPELPDVSDLALQASLPDWLGPFIAGKQAVGSIDAVCLGNALAALLPYDIGQRLDRLAPSHFTAPTGSRVPIDYGSQNGPTIAIRVQELFGLTSHPAICDGRIPLTLQLLSPAQRPLQITRDLPGFWAGSWTDVKSEMKGRYPKHPWPDDPTAAQATNRTKRATS